MSWVTIDRICQEKVDKEGVRSGLVRNGRPLRSSAEPLSDDELLAKLRDFGLDVDRDRVERLCAGALSAEEVAGPIVDKLKLDDDMTVDWVWISLLALWQRWWPDRPGLELLDDKMQAGYARDAENDSHAAVVTWLDAWSDVLRLCDATGISSIEEFDDRFPLNAVAVQLESGSRDGAGERRTGQPRDTAVPDRVLRGIIPALSARRPVAHREPPPGAGRGILRRWHDREGRGAVPVVAGRRSGVGLGLDRLGRLLPAGGRQAADLARAEKLLRRGYRVPGVRDRVHIAERLQEVCEDSGRPDEARQFGEQAERLRQEPLRPAARLAPSAGNIARRVKVGRNASCPCGSGKKFKKCCGSPAEVG